MESSINTLMSLSNTDPTTRAEIQAAIQQEASKAQVQASDHNLD